MSVENLRNGTDEGKTDLPRTRLFRLPLFTQQIANQPVHVQQTLHEYALQLVQYMFVLSQNQRRVVWLVGCIKHADRKFR